MLFKIPMWVGVLLTGLSTLMLLALQQYGDTCRFYMIESGFALTIAFLINVSVISVTGSVCNSLNLNPDDQKNCRDLDLNKASFLLKNVLGNWSSKILAIALLASGQSSTITGTYAGQYVMQGFLDLRLKPWIRNFLTRCLAIVPSLIVAIIGGSSGAGQLIIIASNNLEERNGQLQASASAAEKGLTSENFQKLGESSFVAFFVMLVSLTQMMMVCQIDEQHISMFILF